MHWFKIDWILYRQRICVDLTAIWQFRRLLHQHWRTTAINVLTTVWRMTASCIYIFSKNFVFMSIIKVSGESNDVIVTIISHTTPTPERTICPLRLISIYRMSVQCQIHPSHTIQSPHSLPSTSVWVYCVVCEHLLVCNQLICFSICCLFLPAHLDVCDFVLHIIPINCVWSHIHFISSCLLSLCPTISSLTVTLLSLLRDVIWRIKYPLIITKVRDV